MLKRSIAVLSVVLAMGCASTSMKPADSSAGTKATTQSVRRLPITNYVLLSSPTLLYSIDDENSSHLSAFYVRGTMTSVGFVPQGKVEGRGKFCADGKDWLSLADQKVHKASEGTPVAPYLLGCSAGSSFVPASRDIVTAM